jgi:hydrogenase/urease accessory protein HupE
MRPLLYCYLLVWLGYAASAPAHPTRLSYADIRVADQRLAYTLEVSPHDLALLLGLAVAQDALPALHAFRAAQARLASAMRQGIVVHNNGVACPAGAVELDDTRYPETLRLSTTYVCTAPLGRLTVLLQLFFALDPAHKHLGKIQYQEHLETFVLTSNRRQFVLDISGPDARSVVARAWQFLRLGVEHILTGYDHILFLLALLLAGGQLRHLVQIVTAFTIAHSLTLILATLGVVELPSRLVESVIALSIVYVAVENLFVPRLNRRWIVTFVFGLAHGFGFYGVLRDLHLSQQGLVLSLCAFNLGVEVGQVLLVTLCYPALALLARQGWQRQAVSVLSLLIGGLGLYWFVERVLFA